MLHGRGRECARVGQLLAEARERRSGVLVVRGEAGIGKSALLAYAAEHADGIRVLRGVGVESESEFPFAAVHQLLHPVRRYIERLPAPQRAALQGAFGVGGDAGADRFLISVAVLSLLAEVAEEQPLLCLLDDAQWLDGASADALTFAARRLEAEGIALLFAARDDDIRSFAAPGLPALRLVGLDQESAAALLPPSTAPEVREVLVASAAGNPLGLLELPASLSVAQLAGREPLPERLPLGTEVFGQRVRRQPADTQTLLLVAAAEDSGDLGVVLRAAQALGVEAAALDDAEAAGLVRVDEAVISFRHPLVRSAVYEGATFGRRRAVHEALAAVQNGDTDRRSWHLAAAATGPDEEVAAGLERSAERARRRGGHAAAASAWERAAELTAGEEPRARRLAAAAQSAWLARHTHRARGLLDRAAALTSDPLLCADIEHLRGYIEQVAGTPVAAYAVLTAGSELVESRDPAKAALMLADAGQIAWTVGDLPGLREAGDRLERLPAPGGAATVIARLVVGLGAFLRGDTARAATLMHDGVRLAEEEDEPRALRLAAACAMFVGDDVHALALFTRAVARARADGAVDWLPGLLAPLASLEMWTGRHASAAANATEGLRLAQETGQENPAAHHRSVLAWLAAVQGREDECHAAADASLARAIGHRLGPPAGIAAWAVGLSELGAGRPAEAFERLGALAAAGPGEGHQIVTVFASADLVDAAIRAGREDQALAALATLEGWAENTGSAWGHALVARCRGLLSTADKAEGYFAEAIALHAGGGRPFDTARTELAYGQALRRQRRRADARVHLRAAYDGFARLGAEPWAELTRAELRATGETARRREPGTLTQLTPQEHQVARLVGGGATNREVAAQLFLSPRTVDYHLHKVFTKLGIASRAELVLMSLHNPAL
jgi:DNA-binding NarL/FixJ family response regulator